MTHNTDDSLYTSGQNQVLNKSPSPFHEAVNTEATIHRNVDYLLWQSDCNDTYIYRDGSLNMSVVISEGHFPF